MPRPVRLLALALLVATCAPPPQPRAAGPDTIVVALPQEPEHLFAPAATSPEALAVLGAMTEGLVVENERGDLVPGLAERVPSLANGDAAVARLPDGRGALTVRFHLRASARWQDGTPVRPADIRFGWLLLANRDAPVSQRGAAMRIQDVRALDDRTVEVQYRPGEIDPLYALCCNAFVLPEAPLRDVPVGKLADSAFWRAPTYAGPFRLRDEQAGVSITLERSPFYALGEPNLGAIVFVFRPDPEAALSDLAAHRVDVATGGLFTTDRASELASLVPRGMRAMYTPSFGLEHLDFDLRDPADAAKPHPILGSYAVRAALARAIDRPAIARDATADRAPVPESYLPAPSWAADDPSDLTRYPYDPAAARRALDDAGWRVGADGVRAKDGVRLRLRLLVASGSAARDRAADAISRDLRAVGVEVVRSAVSVAMLDAPPPGGALASGDFDLALYAWIGDRDPSAWSLLYLPSRVPTRANGFSGQNFTGWSDARFAALADEAAGSLELGSRRERYLEMQRIWTAALPALPLYQRVQVDVADVRIVGLRPAPTRQPLTWNAAAWSFGVR